MWIIGCDFHPRFQQIAFVNTEGGECGQRRLEHRREAEEFYRSLAGQGVRVGMETGGSSRWFERLLSELGQELWIGDAAKIRAAETRKQKTDARDAEHLRQLLCSGQFEKMRIWIPPAENRDLRQLLWHRHRLVQMRTRVKNQLRSLASSEGMERKPGLWSQRGQQQFQALELAPWAGRRRQDNLELLTELLRRTDPLDEEVAQQAATRSAAADDSSRDGSDYGAGIRAGDRRSRAFSQQQKTSQLSGADSPRGQLRRQATAGTHQQAGQCDVARPAGGSGARGGAARIPVETGLPPFGHAQEPLHCRGGRGPQAGGAVVVDVEAGRRLRPTQRLRFACRVSPL